MAAGLGEGEIAEFVENDDIEAGEIIGNAALTSSAALGFELVDEIDGGEEPPARSRSDAVARDGDRQMGFARACRDSDMAPGVWRVRRESPTRSTRSLG